MIPDPPFVREAACPGDHMLVAWCLGITVDPNVQTGQFSNQDHP
jgi:hypothetical protein